MTPARVALRAQAAATLLNAFQGFDGSRLDRLGEEGSHARSARLGRSLAFCLRALEERW